MDKTHSAGGCEKVREWIKGLFNREKDSSMSETVHTHTRGKSLKIEVDMSGSTSAQMTFSED
jgi:hypothetical protein